MRVFSGAFAISWNLLHFRFNQMKTWSVAKIHIMIKDRRVEEATRLIY